MFKDFFLLTAALLLMLFSGLTGSIHPPVDGSILFFTGLIMFMVSCFKIYSQVRETSLLNAPEASESGSGSPGSSLDDLLKKSGMSSRNLSDAIRESNYLKLNPVTMKVLTRARDFSEYCGRYLLEIADFREENQTISEFIDMVSDPGSCEGSGQMRHYQFWTSLSESRAPAIWERARKYIETNIVGYVKIINVVNLENIFFEKWMVLTENIRKMEEIKNKYSEDKLKKVLDNYNLKLLTQQSGLEKVEKILGTCTVFKMIMMLKAKLISLRNKFDLRIGVRTEEIQRCIIYREIDLARHFLSELNKILEDYNGISSVSDIDYLKSKSRYLSDGRMSNSLKTLESFVCEFGKILSSDISMLENCRNNIEFIVDMIDVDTMVIPDVSSNIHTIDGIIRDYIELNSDLELSITPKEKLEALAFLVSEPEMLNDLSDNITNELALMNLDAIGRQLSTELDSIEEIDQIYNFDLEA